ncbi:hypothetical protein [Microlunatus soli]|uniref:Uncharacterized protein n=1 Tax=Microlunatus soli TaxID=630515 RepID=A0A1H1UQG7_9ACTN|nr:hypothetical protein [Microlunatus soli]SDS74089.1 hypothetical protein SAMN04489812_2866 [Microlunatus soli]
MRAQLATALGWWINVKHAPRDERGLSQSTEVAILLGAAVLVALAILGFVTGYVQDRLGQIKQPKY